MRISLNVSSKLSSKVNKLLEWLKSYGKVVVMMSGGLDSGVLAYLSSLVLPDSTYGVTVKSANVPVECVSEAVKMAGLFNIFHKVLELDLLAQEGIQKNPFNRCYLCKKFIIKRVKDFASGINVKTILEGSNLHDLHVVRPGQRALEEEGVLSPFIVFKLGKKDIRSIASSAGLYFHDKPSESCLLTRFPYNVDVTVSDLKRVERAEKTVRDYLNTRLVRVRDYGWWCRLELDLNDFKSILDRDNVNRLVGELKKLGYKYVTLDLEGYRTGSMDV